MAGDEGMDSAVHQQVTSSGDAYVAGRDMHIHVLPPVPESRARIWGGVPARNPGFTGREVLLDAVRAALAGRDRAVVRGSGGVGKTQIAIEYAHRFANDYDLVWWVNAERAEMIVEQFAALAAHLGCARDEAQVTVMRRTVLTALHERERLLLIFDNAERPEGVTDWLPGGTGHVLITSRARAWDEVAIPVEVGMLSRAESIALLTNRVARLPYADAAEVAGVLDDFPLAITQAAGYMSETGMSAVEYVGLVKKCPGKILGQGKPTSYPHSLAASTEISYDRLREADPAAADVAVICAFLAPYRIPAAWFAAAAPKLSAPLREQAEDPFEWHQALASLSRIGLASVDQDGIIMHRLTQAIIREIARSRLANPEELASAVVVAGAPGDPTIPGMWHAWATVLPHLRALGLDIISDHADLRIMAYHSVSYLTERGDVGRAQLLAGDLHNHWRSKLGPDHDDTMCVANTLAGALLNAGRYEDARDLFQEVFTRRRVREGLDHPDTLAVAASLAGAMRGLRLYTAARELDEDTLGRYRNTLGSDHADTLRCAEGLSGDLYRLGEHQAARELAEDTLARHRRAVGGDHPDTLRMALNLVPLLAAAGEPENAIELAYETMERCQQALGQDHPVTLTSAVHVATILSESEDPWEARSLFGDTLERQRRVLGEGHPQTQLTIRKLAVLSRSLGFPWTRV
jgi:Tetratricopeptide repeat/NB-ARC domain